MLPEDESNPDDTVTQQLRGWRNEVQTLCCLPSYDLWCASQSQVTHPALSQILFDSLVQIPTVERKRGTASLTRRHHKSSVLRIITACNPTDDDVRLLLPQLSNSGSGNSMSHRSQTNSPHCFWAGAQESNQLLLTPLWDKRERFIC